MADYRLFHKTVIGKDGKEVARWYYTYTDSTGKRKQAACKKCRTKAEAESYLSKLPPLRAAAITVEAISLDMYIPGSDHYERRKQLGKSIKSETLVECRGYLTVINKLWGHVDIRDLTVVDVHRHLLKDKHSASWKNRVIEVLGEVYSEAPWHGCKVVRPEFPRFSRTSKKADILETSEIDTILDVENFENEAFYLMYRLALSGGMRLGEARAFRPCQYIERQIAVPGKTKKATIYAIIIDGFLNKKGHRNPYNKKGSVESPRLRAAIIPKTTAVLIKDYIANTKCPADQLLFQYDGKPIRQEFAETVFKRALKKANIKINGRKLVPHSLRYTYVTRMRRSASADTVGKMSGHTSIEMTDYYTRAALDEMVDALLPAKNAADQFFA